MRKLILLPCLLLLVAAAPAIAAPQATAKSIAPSDPQQNASASAGSSTGQTAPEEKKICKQLPTSDSRLPNRACLTAREWKQVEDDLSH